MKLNKVHSWNPRLVKKISLKKASKLYLEYILLHFDLRYGYSRRRLELLVTRQWDKLGIKDFKTWLSTEI